jgi:hypothetical protein
MDSKLFDLDTFNFALYKNNKITKDVNVYTKYQQVSKADIVEKFKSPENIDYLIDEINKINGNKLDRKIIYLDVIKYMLAWSNLGKFDNIPKSINIITLLDYYNSNFISAFAYSFNKNEQLPLNLKQSPSELNGMPAQQTQYFNYNNCVKKTPFYERALYKRNYDKYTETNVNDHQGLFYAMDNHKYENDLRKMDEVDDKISSNSYVEREMPVFKLK